MNSRASVALPLFWRVVHAHMHVIWPASPRILSSLHAKIGKYQQRGMILSLWISCAFARIVAGRHVWSSFDLSRHACLHDGLLPQVDAAYSLYL